MRKLLLIITMGLLSFSLTAQTTYIHCGKLIDVEKSKVLSEMTIVVENDKIMSIEKGYSEAPGDAKVIDLKSKTVMPGLFDMHVHLESETSKDNYIKRFIMNEADIALQSTVYAKKHYWLGLLRFVIWEAAESTAV